MDSTDDTSLVTDGDPALHEQVANLLAEVTQGFASSLNVEETLKNAIDQIMSWMRAEAASIFLLDEDEQAIICRKCAGPVDVTGLKLKPGQGIVGQTMRENAPQIVRDVAQSPSFAAVVDRDTGFVTRSVLCVPLTVRGRCIGALELMNKRGGDGLFGKSDMHLATTVAAAAALAIHNARMAQALVEQERVRKELELARAIQLSLLPQPTDDHFPVHGLNFPAREVSGDFYDFLALPDGRIYFSIADVSGKGMNAALLMAKATSLLRCLAKVTQDPGHLLEKVNVELCETSSMGMFVTITAGYLYPEDAVVEFANAGHQPTLVRHTRGNYTEVPAQSPPLGISPEFRYEAKRVELSDGTVYFYTDGATEALDAAGRPLGRDGLMAAIEAAVKLPAAERLPRVLASLMRDRRRFQDDVTLLLIDGGGRGR
ncbi:MAG: SpoIIE family protein phosphatase [Gammaproteobacteria bacterium]|nr:SpoIIE family protein phosphatase [Gammaproteobacteria bacterium]MBI5615383.1 SpoIIE family protein phosphatase [Gammaproteobacteria bacterium]